MNGKSAAFWLIPALCLSTAAAAEYGYYEYHAENPLNAISGASAASIWAVGDGGLVVHHDGSSWTPESSGTTADLASVAAVDATHAYAVGGDALYARGASGWEKVADIAGASKVEALPDGRAWVLGTAGIYRYEGTGTPALLGLADAGTIWDFSLVDADGLWLAGSDSSSSDFVIWSYISGTLQEENRIPGTQSQAKSIFALDNQNVWFMTHTASAPSAYWDTLHYYDGGVWSQAVASFRTRFTRVKGFGPGEVYALGLGVYIVSGVSMTLGDESLLPLKDLFVVPGGDIWSIDDYSVLHHRGWPIDTAPVGVKIAGYWAATPSSSWNPPKTIIATACLQPNNRAVDVYVVAWDPAGAVYSVLPGNRVVPGVQPYARGIGPVAEPLYHTVYNVSTAMSSPGEYTIGIGLVPAGQPPTWAGLVGSYVGPLYTQYVPLLAP